jgi:hypothetical protein
VAVARAYVVRWEQRARKRSASQQPAGRHKRPPAHEPGVLGLPSFRPVDPRSIVVADERRGDGGRVGWR